MTCPYFNEFRSELAAHRKEVREMMQAHFDEMFAAVQGHPRPTDGDRPSVTVNVGKLASLSPSSSSSVPPSRKRWRNFGLVAGGFAGGLGAVADLLWRVLR